MNDFISSFPKFPLATPRPRLIKSFWEGLIVILFLWHKVNKIIQPTRLLPSLNPWFFINEYEIIAILSSIFGYKSYPSNVASPEFNELSIKEIFFIPFVPPCFFIVKSFI